jgi:mannose-6-phosphate isomerase
MALTRFASRIVEKPWGRCPIDARFQAPRDAKVGEIWFEPPSGQPIDVMAKYLFTSERLSIQVHPDDATARARGHPRGKDECWIVVAAEPGAEIGIGTVREVAPAALIEAARDGSIVDLIDWRPARAGQFLYNPAGTVHALGAGLTILEIQQRVDLTYRLFDYGRPRELHLTEAEDVVRPEPHFHAADRYIEPGESAVLVDGEHFGVAWCHRLAPPLPDGAQDVQLLPIDAPASIAGETLAAGQCALVDRPDGIRSEGDFVLTWSRGPDSALDRPGQS